MARSGDMSRLSTDLEACMPRSSEDSSIVQLLNAQVRQQCDTSKALVPCQNKIILKNFSVLF